MTLTCPEKWLRMTALLIIVGNLLMLPHTHGQSASPSSSLTDPAASIQTGDLLRISVTDVAELSQNVRVSDEGDIVLFLIGRIDVASLTVTEAEASIASALQDYVRKPNVTIEIEKSDLTNVGIYGDVANPGLYTITTSLDLSAVLAMAGGLTSDAPVSIYVSHRNYNKPALHLTVFNEKLGLSKPVMIQRGDWIHVQKAPVIYVLGSIAQSGGYVIEKKPITVEQAVILAGGLIDNADVRHAKIVRETDGQRREMQLDAGKMSTGTVMALELLPRDIVYIPSSRRKDPHYDLGSLLMLTQGAQFHPRQ